MDKHQCTRPLLHENDPFGNITENFADLFNLSVDTKTSKTGITDEIKKEVGTTFLKVTLILARKIAHHVTKKINEEIGLFAIYFENT